MAPRQRGSAAAWRIRPCEPGTQQPASTHETKLDRCGHIGPAMHHPGSWVSERNSVLIKSTSPTSENKVWNRLVRYARTRLAAAGTRLSAKDDLRALQHGWQIIPHRSGLSRQYRDPRFDTLTGCRRCDGTGATDGWPCPACRGTGRQARHPSSKERGGEGHDQDPLAPAK